MYKFKTRNCARTFFSTEKLDKECFEKAMDYIAITHKEISFFDGDIFICFLNSDDNINDNIYTILERFEARVSELMHKILIDGDFSEKHMLATVYRVIDRFIYNLSSDLKKEFFNNIEDIG